MSNFTESSKLSHRSAFPSAGFTHEVILARCWREEVEFLRAIAASSRKCRPILQQIPIGIGSFLFTDTAAIYLAIEDAANLLETAEVAAVMALDARQRLINANAWDQENHSDTAAPRRVWGPQSLAAVLIGVPFDAVQICKNAALMLDTGTRYMRTIVDVPCVA